MTELEDLVPGLAYRVRWRDCCVSGDFTDVFVSADDDGDLNFARTTINGDGDNITFTEAAE